MKNISESLCRSFLGKVRYPFDFYCLMKRYSSVGFSGIFSEAEFFPRKKRPHSNFFRHVTSLIPFF